MSATSELFHRLDAAQASLTRTHEDASLEAALAVCAAADMPVLGLGGRRLAVALTQTKVAKLAFRRDGLADNVLEWRLWNTAPADVRQLLAPTLLHTDGGVNIQTRCLPVTADALTTAESVTRPLARYGIIDASSNLGRLDDRTVCFDYALMRPELAMDLLRRPASAFRRDNAATVPPAGSSRR